MRAGAKAGQQDKRGIDRSAAIVADAEAGFAGPVQACGLTQGLIEVGAEAYLVRTTAPASAES